MTLNLYPAPAVRIQAGVGRERGQLGREGKDRLQAGIGRSRKISPYKEMLLKLGVERGRGQFRH
jgi:hypothetical protein